MEERPFSYLVCRGVVCQRTWCCRQVVKEKPERHCVIYLSRPLSPACRDTHRWSHARANLRDANDGQDQKGEDNAVEDLSFDMPE